MTAATSPQVKILTPAPVVRRGELSPQMQFVLKTLEERMDEIDAALELLLERRAQAERDVPAPKPAAERKPQQIGGKSKAAIDELLATFPEGFTVKQAAPVFRKHEIATKSVGSQIAKAMACEYLLATWTTPARGDERPQRLYRKAPAHK